VNGFQCFESIFASERARVNFDARFRSVSGFWLAIRYLTIVPAPALAGGQPLPPGRAAGWFPLVGLLLGGLVAAVDGLAVQCFSPLVSAVLTVTLWKVVTGGLHVDGFADCLDGLKGSDPQQRLALMRDSRIGVFGALGLVLFLALEIAAVAEAPPTLRWRLLLTAPAVGRMVPSLLARLFRPACPEGQGAAFVTSVTLPGAVMALAVAATVAAVILGVPGAVAAGLAVLAATAVAWFFARRLRGLTGDVLGAAVETSEVIVILTVLAWAGARA
jgi:adenosylcobinamide-GDP ribazoletransferase